MDTLIELLLGGGLGVGLAVLVWVLPGRVQLRRARQERDRQRADLQALREEHAGLQERAQRVPQLEDNAAQLRAELQEVHKTRAGLQAQLETERKTLEKRFHEMAGDTLQKNSATFLQLVSERFATHKTAADKDLDARRQAVENLVKPLGENLEKFQARVTELRKETHSLAAGQLDLRSETGRLVRALRRPQIRGRWGEFQLRNVLELAGMQEHADFLEQVSLPQGDRSLRPDVQLNLPDGKHLIVDAKTPLEAYLSAWETDNEEERAQHLRDHVRQFREHIQKLSSKEYWKALPNTPDFVVMFVPGEAFFSVALEQEPGLFESALEKQVLLCTPTTFIALVKAIAYGWRQERFTQNAEDVMRQARELHDRLCVFVKHMGKLGNSLQKTVHTYNDGIASLESRVLPTARKFEALGATPAQQTIPPQTPIDLSPRPPRPLPPPTPEEE